jgi:hypothetical protein
MIQEMMDIWVPSDLQWSSLLFLPSPCLLREFRGHFELSSNNENVERVGFERAS